jgi:hypothetical protein
MLRFRRPAAALLLCAFTAACSTASKDIAPVYVSPIQYQAYDCEQLIAEIQRIHGRASQLGGRLDEAASNDKAIVAGSLLLWPVLFALGGTKQQEAEYARLRGEHDAATQAAIQKKCQGVVAAPTAPATPAAEATRASGDATGRPSDDTARK